MSERGAQLFQAADSQIGELIDLLSAGDEAALRLPCPGRQKLGDGTLAAVAAHTAQNYLRIASFLKDAEHAVSRQERTNRAHRIPKFLRARGHGDHDRHRHSAPADLAVADRRSILDTLSAARRALGPLAELTDEQLRQVPAASEMRFCDGQRTVEEIARSLLGHQEHQVDAVRTALA